MLYLTVDTGFVCLFFINSVSVISSEKPMENKLESLTEGPSSNCSPSSETAHSEAQEESSAVCVDFAAGQTVLTQSDNADPFTTEEIKDCQISSYQGMNSRLQSTDDVFSTFLYWRPPLPDISQDLELLQCKTEIHEESCSVSEVLCNNCVASSEIKKVLQSLQEHMDDPDVQGKFFH